MCFGNNSTTSTQTTNQNTSYTPDPRLTAAADTNLAFAQGLQSKGFTPYTGQQVANFAPQQTAAFGMGTGISGAVTPNIQLAGTGLTDYLAKTEAGSAPITADTIASRMSPYMNQYVQLALDPQLKQLADQYMLQSQAMQGQATSAGAFGDPRAQILQSNLGNNFGLQREGLIGSAYNAAFNTAIGAGAQDVANNVNAQIATGNQRIANLGAQLSGINTGYTQGVGATNLLDTLGGQQTAQSQAELNAKYNQYLMALGYPFQATQLVNQSIGAAVPASPSRGTSSGTTTTTQPDNSGFGILGSLIGAAGQMGAAYLAPSALMLAEGGPLPSNRPAIVGERGPELFVPDSDDKGPGLGAWGGQSPSQFGSSSLHTALGATNDGFQWNRGQDNDADDKGGSQWLQHLMSMPFVQSNPDLMSELQRVSGMLQQQGGAGMNALGGAAPPSFSVPAIPPSQMTPGNGPRSTVPALPIPIATPPSPPIQIAPGAGANQASPPQQARTFESVNDGDTSRAIPISGGFVPARALGGPIQAGQPTMVGENGPELVVSNQPGTVIPNHMLPKNLKKKKPNGLASQLGAAA